MARKIMIVGSLGVSELVDSLVDQESAVET